MWEQHEPFLEEYLWGGGFWEESYYVGTAGDVSTDTDYTLTELFAQMPRLFLIAESIFTISDDGTDPMFFFTRSSMSTTRI